MGFLSVASGDGNDKGDAGLRGAVRTSGRRGAGFDEDHGPGGDRRCRYPDDVYERIPPGSQRAGYKYNSATIASSHINKATPA